MLTRVSVSYPCAESLNLTINYGLRYENYPELWLSFATRVNNWAASPRFGLGPVIGIPPLFCYLFPCRDSQVPRHPSLSPPQNWTVPPLHRVGLIHTPLWPSVLPSSGDYTVAFLVQKNSIPTYEKLLLFSSSSSDPLGMFGMMQWMSGYLRPKLLFSWSAGPNAPIARISPPQLDLKVVLEGVFLELRIWSSPFANLPGIPPCFRRTFFPPAFMKLNPGVIPSGSSVFKEARPLPPSLPGLKFIQPFRSMGIAFGTPSMRRRLNYLYLFQTETLASWSP